MTVKLENLRGGNMRLTEPYSMTIDAFGIEITVPKGFVTDGASIPRIVWPIIGPPMRGDHLEPAVVHDYLCLCSWAAKDYSARVVADAIFFHLLKRFGIPYWKRALMYVAVRFWGRYVFKPSKIRRQFMGYD